MADNIQIPSDLTKVLEIKVEDKSNVLRKFLTDLANKVNKLEERIAKLEAASGN